MLSSLSRSLPFLPLSSSSSASTSGFLSLPHSYFMYGINRSGRGLRVGQILVRISASEASSEKSSELSAHQISLGSQLGQNPPSWALIKSLSELASDRILRAERSSNTSSEVVWNTLPHSSSLRSAPLQHVSLSLESIATTSAHLGRTNRPDSSRAVCTLRARSRRGPPQPGSTPLPACPSLPG